MPAFYLTLIAVLLSGFAARDQVTLAGITARNGRRPALLIAGLVLAFSTAAFAAWAGSVVAATLAAPARSFLAGLVLVLAGLESLILAPRYRAREPTHSLGATGLVLLVHQLTDAARFLIFGVAVATNAPIAAGAGGALGGIVLLTGAWLFPQAVRGPRARWARRAIGGLLLLVGLYVGLDALDFV